MSGSGAAHFMLFAGGNIDVHFTASVVPTGYVSAKIVVA